jgi:hypothetical protein
MSISAITSVAPAMASRQLSSVKAANDGGADDRPSASATNAAPVRVNDGDADDRQAVSTAAARSSASVQAALSTLGAAE